MKNIKEKAKKTFVTRVEIQKLIVSKNDLLELFQTLDEYKVNLINAYKDGESYEKAE